MCLCLCLIRGIARQGRMAPKLFYAARPSSSSSSSLYSRRSKMMVCLIVGLIVFGVIGIWKQALTGSHTRCKHDKPLSVSVTWDTSTSTSTSTTSSDAAAAVVDDLKPNRRKVMGFVGIQTGFGSAGRRRALRNTWFPSDHQGLQRYYLNPNAIVIHHFAFTVYD